MKKLKYLIIIVLSLMIFNGCKKQELINTNDSNNINENTLSEKLKFKKFDISDYNNSKLIIVKISWDEWGHLPDCGGWGLCDVTVEWFPEEQKGDQIDEHKYSSALHQTSNTDLYYMDILLAEPVPDNIDMNKYPLIINQPIILDLEEKMGKKLVLAEENYKFMSNIGEYGGYRIFIY